MAKRGFKVFIICVMFSMLFTTYDGSSSCKAVMGLNPPTTAWNWSNGNPYYLASGSNTSQGALYTEYYFTGGHFYSFYISNVTNPVVTNAAFTVKLYAKSTLGSDILVKNCGTIYPGQSLNDYINNASTASQYYLKFEPIPGAEIAVVSGYFSKAYKGE